MHLSERGCTFIVFWLYLLPNIVKLREYCFNYCFVWAHPKALHCSALSFASKKEGEKIKTPIYEVGRVVERSNDRVSRLCVMLNLMTLPIAIFLTQKIFYNFIYNFLQLLFLFFNYQD